MALLLKQLDIHGFKSFATPTTFVFDRGITAVIGPNGSGKSNVAEALRWVLGEQGHANLRSRRTEDVIFAGSDKRAQLGLAEVTLTLDNSDGEIPLPFSEITISRRAFRSGESQYLINGGRVRLKDVQQLVAPLGQSYTIIGQGLVDAALSQRPDERRGLFEHAAGISGLRLRANDAERSLSETSANAQRLRDILSELEPRVRSLDRQARLARDYSAARERLHTLLRQHYAHQWTSALQRMSAASALASGADAELAEQEQAREAELRRLSGLRADERGVLETLQATNDRLLDRERALSAERHQLDLLETRARAAAERLEDLRATLVQLERERTTLDAERTALEAARDELQTRAAALETTLQEYDQRVAAERQRRADMQREVDAAERDLLDLARQAALAEGQIAAIEDRRTLLHEEHQQLAQDADESQRRLAELELVHAESQERLTINAEELDRVGREIAQHESELATERQALRSYQLALDSATREQNALQTRLDALQRTHASGEGLYAGVRAVLRGVRRGELELPGLVGTLAEVLSVPPEYETAVEVALGGHLQDIIVERWDDAQAAIDFLKRSNAGRATFQPLDTVRAGRRPALNARDQNLIGVAADLVTSSEQVNAVIEQLLGRTLLVTDLEAARRLLSQVTGWTIVTLSGEITRTSGSVTGGGRVAESGLLARERDRRALPGKIAGLRAQADTANRDSTAARQRIEALERASAALRATHSQTTQQRQQLEADASRMERELDNLRARQSTGRERLDMLAQRERELAEQMTQARARVEQDSTRRAESTARIRRLREELSHLATGSESDMTASRTELATVTERLRSTERAIRQGSERLRATVQSIESRTSERERLESQAVADVDRRQTRITAIERLSSEVDAVRATVAPLEAERTTIRAELSDAERRVDRATERVRDAERERDRAMLSRARAHDEQAFLAERIRADLELDDPSALLAVASAEDPVPDEQDIARMRERLRRMSVVSDDVVEQFDSESQRLAFLSQQLADVDEATAGLRKVLAELNAQMTTRFEVTFRDVAVAFAQTFTRLFGGGSARLVLSGLEDGASGIDIIAQPPGKRLQNLNALSGGERALTAVALLIAIQRVNPSPFCLLDEVDAALDESNVIRFRDEVRDLARTTQFVIITHNRGTIEGADTLYGVTMGDDGVSRMLSLRLEDAIRAVEEYEALEATGS
jgi:chromosome segregation protein